MAKKKVFGSDKYEVEIGDNKYVLQAQPIEQVMEFSEVIEALTEDFDKLRQYYIYDKSGEQVEGPFKNSDDAEQSLNGTEGNYVGHEDASFNEILGMVVSAPYQFLHPLIPDLTEQDARKMNFPTLKGVLETLVEVNGIEWFRDFLAKSLGPLVPRIVEAVISGIETTLMPDTTGTTQEDTGETQ